jgi:hypothetical protein
MAVVMLLAAALLSLWLGAGMLCRQPRNVCIWLHVSY